MPATAVTAERDNLEHLLALTELQSQTVITEKDSLLRDLTQELAGLKDHMRGVIRHFHTPAGPNINCSKHHSVSKISYRILFDQPYLSISTRTVRPGRCP